MIYTFWFWFSNVLIGEQLPDVTLICSIVLVAQLVHEFTGPHDSL